MLVAVASRVGSDRSMNATTNGTSLIPPAVAEALSPLACLSINPAPQPLGGLACTLEIVPYVALYRWRLDHEWVVAGCLLLTLWLCGCICCCVCCRALLALRSSSNDGAQQKDKEHTIDVPSAEDDDVGGSRAPQLGKRPSSHVCIELSQCGGGTSACASQPPPPRGVPPPPKLMMMPPPPPPGCGPGIYLDRASSRWIEHSDPATGDKYYEDQSGNVTWDEPPKHKVVKPA